MAQVAEGMPSKYESLNSTQYHHNKKKEKRKNKVYALLNGKEFNTFIHVLIHFFSRSIYFYLRKIYTLNLALMTFVVSNMNYNFFKTLKSLNSL
jgi:hypothetical protein